MKKLLIVSQFWTLAIIVRNACVVGFTADQTLALANYLKDMKEHHYQGVRNVVVGHLFDCDSHRAEDHKLYMALRSMHVGWSVSAPCLLKNISFESGSTAEFRVVPYQIPYGSLCRMSSGFTTLTAKLLFVYVRDHTTIEAGLESCNLEINQNLFLFRFDGLFIDTKEVFKVHPGSGLVINQLPNKDSLLDRRSNLAGITLKAAVAVYNPFITGIEGPDGQVAPQGLVMDMINLLAVKMNFSLAYQVFGFQDWELMIELTGNKTLDIGIAGYAVTEQRAKKADFSWPFVSSPSRLIFRPGKEKTNWLAYTLSFQKEAWLGVLAYTAVIAFLFFALQAIGSRSVTRPGDCLAKCAVFGLFALIGKRFPVEPRCISARVAFFSISFSGFIIISLYRAMLAASLAVTTKIGPPFQSLEGMADSEYKVYVYPNSVSSSFFEDAQVDSARHRIGTHKLLPLRDDLQTEMDMFTGGGAQARKF